MFTVLVHVYMYYSFSVLNKLQYSYIILYMNSQQKKEQSMFVIHFNSDNLFRLWIKMLLYPGHNAHNGEMQTADIPFSHSTPITKNNLVLRCNQFYLK